MTALATAKDLFLDHLAQFDNHWEDAPFASLRQEARDRFYQLPLPGPKTEDWRFTSLAGLLKVPFQLNQARAPKVVLPPPPTPDTLRLIFINNHLDRTHSTLLESPQLQLGLLSDHADQTERYLGQIAEFQDHPFTALNTSLLADGVFLRVPDNQVVDRPIEILFVSTGDRPGANYPRVLILLGKNSQARILERYQGTGITFQNVAVEMSLDEGAQLDHYKVQQESLETFHFANTQALLRRNSRLVSHYLGLGGGWVRNETRVRFQGEGAEATVNGLYLGGDRRLLDNLTVIDHAVPHCASHELYKGILWDQAQGVFNGKIFVRPQAQKTDAKQTNQVLLLSEQATINTKPQLEIFADDVKCTHGSTVGQLSEDQLFYLQSRGIGRDAARNLLTFAFANDIVNRIQLETIRAELEDFLVHRNFAVDTP